MSGHVPLGPAYIRAGYSESSSRDPALDAAGGAIDLLERDELPEAAIGYDAGGRISAEAIAFRQFRHDGIENTYEGDGARLIWQLAPHVAMRLWTLRDFSPGDGSTFTETSAPGNSSTPQNAIISRQLFWSTYTNGPTGIRFDAIAHRDVTSADATLALDVSVFIPVLSHVAVAAGTVQHHTRTYYLGIRAL